MQQDIFIDGISNIHITGTVVRFDLVSLQPQANNANGNSVFEQTGRIVMTAEAFLQAFQLQEAAIQQMLQSGIIQRQVVNPQADVAPLTVVDKLTGDE